MMCQGWNLLNKNISLTICVCSNFLKELMCETSLSAKPALCIKF